MDTFVTSEKQIGSYTVSKAIDGWNDNQGSLRIDYIFATKEFVPETYQVMFDGISGPVVSDHFGVAVKFN
jgi:maltose 6'-phosphate phosphatase